MSDERIYIVMRTDLKMGKGKEVAQAAHAVRYIERVAPPQNVPIICVRAETESALWDFVAEAQRSAQTFATVADAGRTQNAPGTVTCAAILTATPGPLLAAAKLR